MEFREQGFEDPQVTPNAFDLGLQPENLLKDLIEEAKAEDDYDDKNSVGCKLAEKVMQVWEHSFPQAILSPLEKVIQIIKVQ